MYLARIFPWGCNSGFLRRIVPDAAPQHGLTNGMPQMQKQIDDVTAEITSIHNNNNKGTPLLVQRTPSIGERVL